ncbi:hypothetical protein BLA29_004989, partial [Euroglyphus maynei]
MIVGETTTTTDSDIEDNHRICDDFTHFGDNESNKLNIMAVGLTRHHMIVVTDDFYVFEVGRNKMQTSIHNLYLDAKPLPLSEKYPELSGNHRFRQIKSDIYNAFIVIDDDGSWLCFTTKPDSPYNGINFNMEKSTISEGWSFTAPWKEVLISTTEPCNFYAIRRHEGQFQICTYQCSKSTIKESKKIQNKDDYRSICYSDESDDKMIFIYPDGRHCKNPVQWPILKGFVADGKFYLFGKNFIYTFDENAYDHSSTREPYPVRSETYDSFFICPGKIPRQKSTSSWVTFNRLTLIMMMAIIIIGFIILVALLIVKSIAIQRRRRRGHQLSYRTIRSTDM